MARIVFGDPIPPGVYPWPEDAAHADRDELTSLKRKRDRLEIKIYELTNRLDDYEGDLAGIEDAISELESRMEESR